MLHSALHLRWWLLLIAAAHMATAIAILKCDNTTLQWLWPVRLSELTENNISTVPYHGANLSVATPRPAPPPAPRPAPRSAPGSAPRFLLLVQLYRSGYPGCAACEKATTFETPYIWPKNVRERWFESGFQVGQLKFSTPGYLMRKWKCLLQNKKQQVEYVKLLGKDPYQTRIS